MRVWADVYDQSGAKVATIAEIISASTSTRLDEAGTFELSGAVSEKVVDYLVRDNEVAIYRQEDTETPVLWMRGKIIKPRTQETGDSITISISGRDLLEELRWVVVGLGRTYTAQTVQAIMDDLTSLASGWTAVVESAHAADLQTARFDGTKVLKAILKSVDQLGLHIRNSTTARVLEVGAFGDMATTASGATIRALHAPTSIGRELYDNDAVLLVDSISVTEDGDTLVNWAIPMGAGEGSAATTLKYTTYEILNTDNTVYRAGTTPYFPIYRRVNDQNIEEFYIDASDGATQHQDTLSFKEIGPIANSTLAKQYAADALALACIESLKRSRLPLTSYTLTVKKVRVDLRPGDMIHLTYKDVVWTKDDPNATRWELVPLDVDEDLWIMGVQRSMNDSGMTTTLQVNTIDQHIQTDQQMIVDVLDRSEVQNLSIQTFPFGFQDSSERIIQGSTLPSDAQYKTAVFSLEIPDIFTDVVAVKLRLITRPLYSMTDVGPLIVPSVPYSAALDYFYAVYPGTNYPSDITLTIDGVDVTSDLGGPWNPSAGNSAVDTILDITTYIVNAAGGLYQDHSVVFAAGYKTAEAKVSTAHNSSVTNASNGVINCQFLFLGNARGLF